jgi:hypothetical protein
MWLIAAAGSLQGQAVQEEAADAGLAAVSAHLSEKADAQQGCSNQKT